jgi:isopentenyl-diphosphate delta-isomerase
MDKVILVDEAAKEIGFEEKLAAHSNGGRLHRAFSVFIFNSKGELLLQQRAEGKYHSALLWSNTCCGHPRPGETAKAAARRRLKEEMGFECELSEKFSFKYKVDFANGLSENEYDHVLFGLFDGLPTPDPKEAADWKWLSVDKIKKDIKENQKKYSYWFKICFDKVLEYL